MNRRYKLITAICMMVAMLCACGQTGTEPMEVPQEENHNEAIGIYAEDGGEVVADKSIDYAVALMVTINPEMLFYLDDDMNILKIDALNTDAVDVLEHMNFTTGSFSNCYSDFLEICRRQGYIADEGKQNVKLTVVDKGELTSCDYCDDVVANAEEIVVEMGKQYNLDLSSTVDDRILEPARTGAPSEGNEPDDRTCESCDGTGIMTCDACNGSGVEIIIEHVVKEVRNDYVCPICGGKGWVDDGMHGGLTAECGNCTTNGGNGDFRDLAYDRIEEDEETESSCHRCNGAGSFICVQCDGSGQR